MIHLEKLWWVRDEPKEIFKKSFGGELKAVDVGGLPNHVKIEVYSSPFLSSIYLLIYAYYVFDKMFK